MKSAPRGRGTLDVEVGKVSTHGFWLLVGNRKYFVSFKDFPWFRDATIGQLTNVELPAPHHLRWPELDIDLAVDSIDRADRYPLVSSVQTYSQNARAAAYKPRRSRGR